MLMRLNTFYLFLVMAVAVISCSKTTLKGDLIITNVNVIDVRNGRIASGMNVVIIGDSIAQVVPDNGQLIDALRVVDGKGKYLIPGLWDMHVHTWWNYREVFPLLIANGVTGVREMFGQIDSVNKIREEITKGTVNGPDIVTSGAIIDGVPAMWPGSEQAGSTEQARALVRKQIASGVDFIKVYSMLNRDVFLAIANECKKFNVPLSGHIPVKVKLEEAVNAGLQSAEHFFGVLEFCSSQRDKYYEDLQLQKQVTLSNTEFTQRLKFATETFDSSRVRPMIDMLRNNNMWMSPTSVGNRAAVFMNDSTFINDDRVRYLPDYLVNSWKPSQRSREDFEVERNWYKLGLSIMKPMVNGHVRFLAGTDYGNPFVYPGFSLHDELQIFVEEAGFTPLQALQTATINPATFLRKRSGRVEERMSADLVLLSANPLENINNTRKISGVVLKGVFHNGDTLAINLAAMKKK